MSPVATLRAYLGAARYGGPVRALLHPNQNKFQIPPALAMQIAARAARHVALESPTRRHRLGATRALIEMLGRAYNRNWIVATGADLFEFFPKFEQVVLC